MCGWHSATCMSISHPANLSPLLEISNEMALCLSCYTAAHSKEPKGKQKPPSLEPMHIPGVHAADAHRVGVSIAVKEDVKNKILPGSKKSKLHENSICKWEEIKKGHPNAYPFTCSNRVIRHPYFSDAFLPFCGYHATKCVKERSHKSEEKCPAIVLRNSYGLCKCHYEALLCT